MRDFKFRVYDPTADEMYYIGDLAQLVFGMETDWRLWSIEGLICDETDAFLMQYTGLTDKNDKEIFEGDILKRPTEMREETHGNYTYQEVIYRNGTWIIDYLISEKGRILPRGYTAGLLIDCYDQDMKTIVFDDGRLQYTDIEVIGNIYENPELI